MEEKREPGIHAYLRGEDAIVRVEGTVEQIAQMLEGLFTALKKDDTLVQAVIQADASVGLIHKTLRTALDVVEKRVNSKPRTVN